jgi:putative membrane protein
MLKTLRTACVITTIGGLTTIVVRAADPDATPGSSGYGTASTVPAGEHAAKSFIKEAFRDNQMEIDMAGVGIQKAQNSDLRALCEQMQKDHAQANKDLQPLAQKYGVTEEQSMLRQHEVNKFAKESTGAEFDKKLATETLKDHQKDIAKFEHASTKLQESDVKQYAENMLPKLREHLQHSASVARALGVDESTISSALSKAAAVGGTVKTQESGTGTGTSEKTGQGSSAKQIQPTTPPSQP